MFTGIVQDLGRVEAQVMRDGAARLTISVNTLDLSRVSPGDSISVQGVCLTALAIAKRTFEADVSAETLAHTTLGGLEAGSPVNLEPALRVGDALGGHLVSGHVDGVGQVASTSEDAGSLRVVIAVPEALSRYIARKGSVTVDGVSLTVNDVDGRQFGMNLIPHTRAATTLGALKNGDGVNLEIDVVARYVERLLSKA